MEPETTKKRPHSALQEPSFTQGSKRTKHETGCHKPAMLAEIEAFRLGRHRFESQFLNKPTDSNQPETPGWPSDFTHPEPLNAQSSPMYLGNWGNQGFAPDFPSSPATIVASGYNPSSDRLRWSQQCPSLHGLPQNLVSQNSEDSPTRLWSQEYPVYEIPEDLMSQSSEDSSSERSVFTPYRKSFGARANTAASPSSSRTVSDYRSESDPESESESGDGSISTHSTPPPSAFHCSAIPMPDSSALQSRLSSFLPAIRAANETLERERAEGRLASRNIEDVDEDDEQYIEMNLGLGVLEKKSTTVSWRPDGGNSESESEAQSESELANETGSESGSDSEAQTELELGSESGSASESETEDARTQNNDSTHANRGNGSLSIKPQLQASMRKEQETNHLARLMGQPRRPDQPAKKPIIEVLPTD